MGVDENFFQEAHFKTSLITHVTQLKCLKESDNESALADGESKAPDEA